MIPARIFDGCSHGRRRNYQMPRNRHDLLYVVVKKILGKEERCLRVGQVTGRPVMTF